MLLEAEDVVVLLEESVLLAALVEFKFEEAPCETCERPKHNQNRGLNKRSGFALPRRSLRNHHLCGTPTVNWTSELCLLSVFDV